MKKKVRKRKKEKKVAAHRAVRFTQEGGGGWGGVQDVPEKIEKTEHLYQYTDSWPFEEDEEYPTKEADCPAQLVLAREKVERLLRADDEKEAA